MKTKLTVGAMLPVVMIASPAMAGTTATYTMTGTATALCTAGSGGTLAFGTLVNATTGATQIQTSNPSSNDTTAFCNQANTTVLVQRTNLTSSAATASGFTNIVPITSAKVVTPQNATGITDNSSVSGIATSAGVSGTIGAFTQLTVSAVAGTPSASLVASNSYGGAVTITLTPTS